jgi:ABC-type multidrug transport system ATPase subunit
VQGVCPQHNLLWETLTAREHLNFYARLKRLSGPELVAAVDAALRSVNLFDVANKRAGQFSGGALMPSTSNSSC